MNNSFYHINALYGTLNQGFSRSNCHPVKHLDEKRVLCDWILAEFLQEYTTFLYTRLPTIRETLSRLLPQFDSPYPHAKSINAIVAATNISRNAGVAQDAGKTVKAHDCITLGSTRRVRRGNPFRHSIVIIEAHTSA